MSYQSTKEYLAKYDLQGRTMEFPVSSATVGEAALAVGVEEARIAKTLSFHSPVEGHCILLVAAGDARIDNKKFKAQFGIKAGMLAHEEALAMTGHAVGGVCPFDVPDTADVYLDVSLKRFGYVYPACGSANSAVKLTNSELEQAAKAKEWVDVCKDWQ